jgi:hypothetical protein
MAKLNRHSQLERFQHIESLLAGQGDDQTHLIHERFLPVSGYHFRPFCLRCQAAPAIKAKKRWRCKAQKRRKSYRSKGPNSLSNSFRAASARLAAVFFRRLGGNRRIRFGF